MDLPKEVQNTCFYKNNLTRKKMEIYTSAQTEAKFKKNWLY